MAYATAQQAIDLYDEDYVLVSIDRDEDGEVDTTAFSDALDQATSELDSYIGVKYDLPLVVVPDVLQRFTIDMAIYISCPNPAELTDEKKERYEAAVKWAQGVAAGKVSLGVIDQPATAEEDGGGSAVQTEPSSSDRLFTRSTMAGIL